jgi:hypothetical protein
MEDDNNWHYRIPTEEEMLAAWKELDLNPQDMAFPPADTSGSSHAVSREGHK